MKRRPLWEISVTTPPESEQSLASLVERVFSCPASIYADADKHVSVISIYSEDPINTLREKFSLLSASLKKLEKARPRLRRLRHEDWVESWKKHFRPMEIGASLLVKPSWSKRRVRKGQVTVVLDPGLSFGTGQHPTTKFCLRQIVKHRDSKKARSFLDIGTGSGILAIAAAKLGYAPVEAFDLDADAVRIAKANARRNDVGRSIEFSEHDLTRTTGNRRLKFDLVCANLISTLLISEHEKILGYLKADGVLVVAGILKKEFRSVRRVYEKCGLRLVSSRAENEWQCGAFAT